MSTASNQQLVTAEELLRMPDVGRCELIAGELKMMSPAGFGHGRIAMRLGSLIDQYASRENLGEVCGAETGFVLARDPDTVRAPDAAFVGADRTLEDEAPFYPGPPDLAVEVVSPDDRVREVEEKAEAWLAAGTQMVWVVWPSTRTITIHRPGAKPITLGEENTLEGGDVLPGFECRVADVFRRK